MSELGQTGQFAAKETAARRLPRSHEAAPSRGRPWLAPSSRRHERV